MGIFLLMSIKEHCGIISHTIPTQGKPAFLIACPHYCLAYSQGGQGRREQARTGCCIPRSHRNSWSLPCATATEALGTPVCSKHTSDLLNLCKLIFPEWFCFPWTFPIQTTLPAISLLSVTMGRGRFVFMEQELSLQEHPWVLGSGQNTSPGNARPWRKQNFCSEMTDTDGLWSDRIRGRFYFSHNFLY